MPITGQIHPVYDAEGNPFFPQTVDGAVIVGDTTLAAKAQGWDATDANLMGRVDAVETVQADMLPLKGGVMRGTIDMNGFAIVNLPKPKSENDAVRKADVDTLISMLGYCMLNITALWPDGSPMVGVPIEGLTGIAAERAYTDENGVLSLIMSEGDYTLSIPSQTYIDMNVPSKSLTLSAGDVANVTLQAVQLLEDRAVKTFVSSTNITFSPMVESIDAVLIGGGGGGHGGAGGGGGSTSGFTGLPGFVFCWSRRRYFETDGYPCDATKKLFARSGFWRFWRFWWFWRRRGHQWI